MTLAELEEAERFLQRKHPTGQVVVRAATASRLVAEVRRLRGLVEQIAEHGRGIYMLATTPLPEDRQEVARRLSEIKKLSRAALDTEGGGG